jgi:hypothetical protein
MMWVPWRAGGSVQQQRARKGRISAKQARAAAVKAQRKADFAARKKAARAARRARQHG